MSETARTPNQDPQVSNPEATNGERQEQGGGFFNGFTKYIIAFMVVQFAMSYFGKSNKNIPTVRNIFSNKTFYDVHFYLREQNNLDNVLPEELIYTIKDRKYCFYDEYTTQTQSVDDIEVNVTFNTNKWKRKKSKEKAKAEWYLISDIKLHNDQEYKYQIKKGHMLPSFYQKSINILKYVDNLADLLFQQDMWDDTDMGLQRHSANFTNNNSTDAIPNLYYKPSIKMYLASMNKDESVSTFQEYNMLGLPVHLVQEEMTYFPVVALSDFWTMNSELKPINATNEFQFTLKISYGFIRPLIFKQMYALNINEEYMAKTFKISGTKDILVELIKYNTVMYLCLLFVVNVLHSIFSVMGFSSDISYYKNLKKGDGVFTKYIFFNIFSMFISFLYITIQGATFVVKIELFIAFAIEVWKWRKIFSIQFKRSFPFVTLDYVIKFDIEDSKSYENEAISLMMKFLFLPIGVVYFVYRVYYYSQGASLFLFCIEYVFFMMSVFGFIWMTPQIYLNYKLKSVEHLPLKALTFKFLNTIIDDLYAFAVKTPTLYRISVFKDDVIFVIYIYQIIKYRKNIRKSEEELEEEKSKNEKENVKGKGKGKEDVKKISQEKKDN